MGKVVTSVLPRWQFNVNVNTVLFADYGRAVGIMLTVNFTPRLPRRVGSVPCTNVHDLDPPSNTTSDEIRKRNYSAVC